MPSLSKKQIEDSRCGRMGYAKALLENHGWSVNAGPDRLSYVATAPDLRVFNYWPVTGEWATVKGTLIAAKGTGVARLIWEGGGSHDD